MNDLKVFNNEQFGEIRTIENTDGIWFAAVDVCKALEIKNVTQAMQKLDEDERSMFNVGRQGKTNFVNEYGLYSLVLSSRKPEAKAFKRWITHDVIPAIRETGGYNLPDAPDGYLDYTKLELDQRIRIANIVATCRRERLRLVAKVLSIDPDDVFADITTTPDSRGVTMKYLEDIFPTLGTLTPIGEFYIEYRRWCVKSSVVPLGKVEFGRLFKANFPVEATITSYKAPDGTQYSAKRVYRKIKEAVA